MAALLGAHTSTFGTGAFSAGLPAFRPEDITVGVARRLDMKAPTSPQMVEVLPVPGGLKIKVRLVRNAEDYQTDP